MKKLFSKVFKSKLKKKKGDDDVDPSHLSHQHEDSSEDEHVSPPTNSVPSQNSLGNSEESLPTFENENESTHQRSSVSTSYDSSVLMEKIDQINENLEPLEHNLREMVALEASLKNHSKELESKKLDTIQKINRENQHQEQQVQKYFNIIYILMTYITITFLYNIYILMTG
ncbi:C2H2-type zinc finger-containing protein [Tieghemostelium lacteum]|uniref:C2H2-type zinc finger-containing protein n=1 Tax=Tieghemostelium lacteum TaxID=361077 RepID=A0A151ZGG7_TIELA|nr:C2H2-type zinc finger-containing protein [Tieghemostelium lacteum]|eukprot:KYQ93066.1 C2H2-type zinc finger-containing protein [Tieghemostelium lacteum]